VGICTKFVIDACYTKGDILKNVGIKRLDLVFIPKAEMSLSRRFVYTGIESFFT